MPAPTARRASSTGPTSFPRSPVSGRPSSPGGNIRCLPPVAHHAGFPGYTSESEAPTPLSWNWATERLREARSYWICTTSASGAPHAMPVWGVWVNGAVCFGTDPGSVKARNLARDPRLVVHLESGDEAVILHGRAEPLDESAIETVSREYERKYDLRPEAGGAGWFQLRPRRAFAWTESAYPRTMTRFEF
jgi:hypothetical protein